ncbi:aspartic proteinase CDR1-like [Cicer arietinum]|uniref:Aspartic proteinase CDR1-like n=1 Tax=Cicer arietinum TaxID=3827 RepID=A0A1S2YXL5_CICAR|nr:aspartic proteinase CDR1-like [Cicer arietinum]
MISPKRYNSFLTIISILVFHVLHFPSIEAENGGFNVKLTRKSSPYFPTHLMQQSNNIVQATTRAYIGQHLMELYIGTPPIKISGIADSGSDLIWAQCVPCVGCYKQINPLFDSTKSSTYKNISCDSPLCRKLDSFTCSPENHCNYTYAYGDSSVTNGVLALEKFTLTSKTKKPIFLQNIIFGCGHNDTGTFNDHEMGIIGLGGGPLSLVNQIGPLFGGRKFSQCLVPFHTDIRITSKMSFGKGSEVLGNGVVSTSLVAPDYATPYLVTLLGISVENTYLPLNISSPTTVAKGNMLIDSGTPPTLLQQSLYDRVALEVKNRVALTPISDDPSLGTQLCYRTETNLNGPNVTFHFEGADVVLTPVQIFIPPKDGVFCLAFANTTSDVGIYGNFAQSNYLIGYDLERHVVSFKPMDCTKH